MLSGKSGIPPESPETRGQAPAEPARQSEKERRYASSIAAFERLMAELRRNPGNGLVREALLELRPRYAEDALDGVVDLVLAETCLSSAS